MKLSRKLVAVAGVLVFVLQACNIGIQSPSSYVDKAAGTLVAMTMNAVKTASQSAATPFASPAAGSLGPAVLTITDDTNCRSGPSPSYQLIATFKTGATLQILTRDTQDNYWQILIPGTQNNCWISGQYATASGNYKSLPEITPTSGTAGNNSPARPGSLFYNYFCPSLTDAEITLSWTDNAGNENGYREYRKGTHLVDLPANSTTYTDNTTREAGSVFSYTVEAFYEFGTSSRSTGDFNLGECASP